MRNKIRAVLGWLARSLAGDREHGLAGEYTGMQS